MEQGTSWEANRLSAIQEISHILRNSWLIYLIVKNPPPVHTLNQLNSVLAHLTYWRSILILSSYLHRDVLNVLCPSCFSTNTLYAPLLSLYVLRAQLNHLDLITRIIFGEEYKSLRFSLYGLRQSPVNLSLLGSSILLSIL
jgi:hypothetical protein